MIKDCSYVLVHVPDFIRYGSKPSRDISVYGGPGGALEKRIDQDVRSDNDAIAYLPNQVYIGNIHPDNLNHIPKPWYEPVRD